VFYTLTICGILLQQYFNNRWEELPPLSDLLPKISIAAPAYLKPVEPADVMAVSDSVETNVIMIEGEVGSIGSIGMKLLGTQEEIPENIWDIAAPCPPPVAPSDVKMKQDTVNEIEIAVTIGALFLLTLAGAFAFASCLR